MVPPPRPVLEEGVAGDIVAVENMTATTVIMTIMIMMMIMIIMTLMVVVIVKVLVIYNLPPEDMVPLYVSR